MDFFFFGKSWILHTSSPSRRHFKMSWEEDNRPVDSFVRDIRYVLDDFQDICTGKVLPWLLGANWLWILQQVFLFFIAKLWVGVWGYCSHVESSHQKKRLTEMSLGFNGPVDNIAVKSSCLLSTEIETKRERWIRKAISPKHSMSLPCYNKIISKTPCHW